MSLLDKDLVTKSEKFVLLDWLLSKGWTEHHTDTGFEKKLKLPCDKKYHTIYHYHGIDNTSHKYGITYMPKDYIVPTYPKYKKLRKPIIQIKREISVTQTFQYCPSFANHHLIKYDYKNNCWVTYNTSRITENFRVISEFTHQDFEHLIGLLENGIFNKKCLTSKLKSI